MALAKQIADLLTFSRGLLAVALAGLGFVGDGAGLPLAVYLLILSWTSDALDGLFARHSGRQDPTWIGDHDLEIDIAVSGGLLIYMVAAGLLTPMIAVLYSLAWLLIFWRWGLRRSLGMLVQAPIYGGFIWIAVRDAPAPGLWLIVWIIGAIIATWPRFPKEVIPDFLSGMQAVWRQFHHHE